MNSHHDTQGSGAELQPVCTLREKARRIQIGEFVKRELERREWSQVTLAKKAGCDQTTISKIIGGKQRASEEMLRRILVAFNLPGHMLEELPPTQFQPGTNGFRLKVLIIRAILERVIPEDQDECARNYISHQWHDPDYRQLPRTPNMEDAVWARLTAEGYFNIAEGRYLVAYDTRASFRYFLSSYLSHMASAVRRTARTSLENDPEIFQDIALAVDTFETSLKSPERLIESVEFFNLTIASKDRLMACILSGYTNGFRFFLESAESASFDSVQYDKLVTTIMETLLDIVRHAVQHIPHAIEAKEFEEIVNGYVERMVSVLSRWKENTGVSGTSTDRS